jgi:hypothetical protein
LTSLQTPRDVRPGVPRWPAWLTLALVLVAMASAACSRPTLLEPTFDSDEAVARTVLEALAQKDAPGLLRLAVTREEFEELIWPTLPVSRPEVGMPFSYIWNDHFTKSRMYLGQTLARYGGQRYELVRVEFGGTTTQHGTCTISRETRLVVLDSEGRERTLRVMGAMIRQSGRSKVFSYIVD